MAQVPNFQPHHANDSSEDEDENTSQKFVSCDSLRKRITLFLATKEMTQTAFLAAIGGVNSNSFGRFRKLKGAYGGIDNGTYHGARKFFARRDKERKTNAKQKKKPPSFPPKPVLGSGENVSTVAGPANKIAALDIQLPDDLPVFDDCDEVRTKIAQCFHKKELSQAGFAKAIGMTAGAVSKFLSKKGFNQGAGSDVYRNAYRYFEKQRLQRGEAKSNHRQKNESNYPQGYPLVNPPTHMWVFGGKK